jgi:hypothetical protein
LQKPGRTEPKSWDSGDQVAIIIDCKKEAGVKRVHPGEVVGKRGERYYVVALHNGDIEVVHEVNMHDVPPSELILDDKNHKKINVHEIDKDGESSRSEAAILQVGNSENIVEAPLPTGGSSSSSSSSSGPAKSEQKPPKQGSAAARTPEERKKQQERK